MAVNLTRIYTRTGDAGETRLGDNSTTSKTDRSAEGPQLAAAHSSPFFRRAVTRLLGRRDGPRGHYQPHPDPAQERFFFGLLRECLAEGVISRAVVEEEIEHRHVRGDALALVDRV